MKNETAKGCECGRISGVRCDWTGQASGMVTVEYMPRHLRASHEAAGNSGRWPHNGAARLDMAPECAERVVESEDGWASIVEER